MSVLMQLCVSLLVLFFGILLVSLLQKRINAKSILALAAILIVTAGTGYFGLKSDGKAIERVIVKAGKMLEMGRTDKAMDILKSSEATSLREPLLALYKARLYTMSDSPALGLFYYNQVEQLLENGGFDKYKEIDRDALEEELEIVRQNQQDNQASQDRAFAQYLMESGLDPAEYGVTIALEDTSDNSYGDSKSGEDTPYVTGNTHSQDIRSIIMENLQDELDEWTDADKELELEADKTALIGMIDAVVDSGLTHYTKTLPDGEVEEIPLSELCDEAFDLYEEDKSDREFSLSLVKALIADERYDEVLEILTANPTAENMAILSELCMNGLVDASDLEDYVSILPEEAYDRVMAHLEKVCEREEERDIENSANIVEQLEKKLTAVERASENPELAGLKDAIEDKINTNEKDQKHLNLELSKISVYLGDTASADAYLEETFANMDSIQNEEIVEGLSRLDSLSASTDNSFESLKEIPEMVEQVNSSILPVKVPQKEETGFKEHVASYYTKKAIEVNITKIDISAYPKIEATVSFGEQGNGEDIDEKALQVTDTGIVLENFDVKKVKYKGSNIILCVDCSPSMESAFDTVKTACLQFTQKIGRNEQISIVAFDSGIVADYGFEKNAKALEEQIRGLYMRNGTNIHNALLTSLNKLSLNEGENNIIILISDGGNNNPVTPEEMDYLSKLIQNTGTSVYTIGLGDEVDGNYLSEVASRGNGKFIFSPAASQLEAFYDFLHNQIQNQYIISYTVENQDIEERYIDVALTDRGSKGHREYSLYTLAGLTQEEMLAKIEDMDATSGPVVKGLDKKCLILSEIKQGVDVNLLGSGFTGLSQKDIEVRIEGFKAVSQDAIKVTDDTHITFSIPGNIPAGTYSITVRIKDRVFNLPNELEVVKSGSVQTLVFGPYTITANEIKVVDKEKRIAKGNVQINDFLRFKGELIIEGNPDMDHYLNLTPSGESFIAFRKGSTNWFVKNVVVKNNLNLNLRKWQRFAINRDGDPAEIRLAENVDMGLMVVPEPKVTLEPDHVDLRIARLNLNLPMQKYIFLAAGAKPISFEGESSILVTAQQIGLKGEFELEHDASLLGRKLLNVFELKKLAASVDTMKGDFEFETGIGLTIWRSDDNEFALKLNWTECKFDAFELTLPFEIDAMKTPIPVTIKEMTGGVGNLSKIDNLDWSALKKIKYILQTDIEVAKATAVLPFLDNIKWLKDNIPGLLLVDDARMELTIDQFALNFEAKLKLFEEFEIGTVEMAIGHYEFKQSLLNIGPQDAIGFHFKGTRGVDLDFEKVKFTLKTAIGIDINNLGLFGLASGEASAMIDILGINKSFSYDGDALVAIHQNNMNQKQFTIALRGRDLKNGKAAELKFYVNSKKVGIIGIDIPFTEKDTIEFSL